MGAIHQLLAGRGAAGGGAGTLLKWDPTAMGAGITLSNDDHDAAGTTTWRSVFATLGKSGSGKHAYEMEYTAANSGNLMVGIATRENVAHLTSNSLFSADMDAFTALLAQTGWVYKRIGAPNGIDGTASTGAFTAGAVITVALDLDAATPTCRYYENGTLGYTINLVAGRTWYPISSVHQGNTARIRGGSLTFPVAGYSDWG